MKRGLAFVFLILFLVGGVSAAQSAVSTFESIGLYWDPAGGSSGNTCSVEYRESGTSIWNDALDLWFDSGDSEYRGSIVNLEPDTTYEIRLTLDSGTTTTLTSTTWSEDFPIAQTIYLPESSTSTYTISQSGTASGYVLYTHAPGSTATVDCEGVGEDNIYINADYVIVRGLTLKNAKDSGIVIANNRHHIVIEENDIYNFGDGNWDGGVEVGWNSNVNNLIIQRNKIHDPGMDSNSWCEPVSATHPQGTNAISFMGVGPQTVVRYNSIYSTTNFYEDGVMYAETSDFYDNQDIYGNYISHVWDDAIQAEGENVNVRVWSNYIKNWHHAVSSNPVNKGPLYIWRNIAVWTETPNWCGYNPGGFLKTTSNGGGRLYVYHNTMLRDLSLTQDIVGANVGLGSGGNNIANLYSKNNILQVVSGGASISGSCIGDCSFGGDLYSGSISVSEPNGISGTPTYSPTPDYNIPGYTGTATCTLSTSSLGYDDGEVIPNFNDGFTGNAPDIGAHEAGTSPMEFGVDAYLSPSQTCLQLSGSCCSSGQECQGGSFQSSSDCSSLCCIGGTCTTSEIVYHMLEAEDFTIVSPMQIGSDSAASGGAYINTPSGTPTTTTPSVEASHSVNIAKADNYLLWARVYGPDSGTDAVYIGFDSVFDRLYPLVKGVYEWVGVEVTHGSGNFEHSLTAGSHDIVIGHGEPQARVDAIIVTNNLTFVPTGVISSTSCTSGADGDYDSVVSISELLGFISSWKAGSVSISELLSGIGEWKGGC